MSAFRCVKCIWFWVVAIMVKVKLSKLLKDLSVKHHKSSQSFRDISVRTTGSIKCNMDTCTEPQPVAPDWRMQDSLRLVKVRQKPGDAGKDMLYNLKSRSRGYTATKCTAIISIPPL